MIIVYDTNDCLMKSTEPNSVVHPGPSLMFLALVYAVLFGASLVVPSLVRHGPGYITPYETAEHVREFFAVSPSAAQITGFLVFASAIPLGLFTATIVSRLKFLGVRAAGTYIALFGGFMASAALIASGLLIWILSLPAVSTSLTAADATYFLSFVLGGMVFAVGSGLLIAGVSVTGGFSKLLPRGVAMAGLLIALAGELSSLGLLMQPATYLYPITRFGGLAWIIVAAALLPRRRAGQAGWVQSAETH